MTISGEDQDLIGGALDSLGVALTDHHHQWTAGERAIYEEAMAILRPLDRDPGDVPDL